MEKKKSPGENGIDSDASQKIFILKDSQVVLA